MKWFENIIMKLDEYFSRDEQVIINNKNQEIKELQNTIKNLNHENTDYESIINTLQDEINDYQQENSLLKKGSPVSLKVKPTKYRMRPDWNTYLHKSLNNLSKDEKYLALYTEAVLSLELKKSYDNPDSLVYEVITKFHKYLWNNNKQYKTDKENYGVSEYWITPQEAYEQIIKKGSTGDCEDVSAVLWGFLTSALIHYGFENELHRLKRVDVILPIGHAICIWLNNKNQWKRIESTYYPEHFKQKWMDDSDIFKSVYTKVWTGHIFDEETEYIKE